jgi:hypothetical protein
MGHAKAILGASLVLNVCLAAAFGVQREQIQNLDQQLGAHEKALQNASTAPAPSVAPDSSAVEKRPAPEPAPVVAAVTEPPSIKKVARDNTGQIPDEILMRQPRYRALRIESEKNTMYRVHADAIAAIRLSPEETRKLMTLLAEHQMEGSEFPTGRPRPEDIDTGAESPNPPRWRVKMQLNEQRRAAEIESLLGPQKYQQWRSYHESRPARHQVALLDSQAEAIGEPLRSDQRDNLIALLTEEAKQQPPRLTPGPDVPDPSLSLLESDAKRIEVSNRRLLQLATSYLTPQQLKLLEESLDRKLTWARTHAELQREYLAIAKQ